MLVKNVLEERAPPPQILNNRIKIEILLVLAVLESLC